MSEPTARDHMFALIARVGNDGGDWCDEARRLLDQVETEALAKAHRETVARFDAEIQRVDNLLGQRTPAPDFFQPGHTYTSGAYTFCCRWIDTNPHSGQVRAVGWWGRTGSGGSRIHAFAPATWKQHSWIDVTSAPDAAGDH